jgi:hypothetical protein
MYGMLAEFEQPDDLLEAAKRARAHGFSRMEGYTPFPIHGLSDALGLHRTRLPWIVLAGGLCGGAGGFFMQWFASVVHYPLNIGGRPLNSWPAFIVITFELTVLMAGLSAVFGMLALNGLPKPYHPLFNVPNFELASRTHFFLCIEARDPNFDPETTRQFLAALPGVNRVDLVPAGRMDAVEPE